ncbi:TetR/AcrR family transcriptional regulator [Bacillus sp. JJ722]|uniref:TetR/AcrR family transcriptional regulator n=1 Tax=Bacillus sp. JJ722 TaxID=3122973 RepID=UPI002FFD6534
MKEKEKIIIESAIKLFAAKGYSATSINEIVKESGISKGAFYLYFKSKDALLLAIFQHYSEQLEQKMLYYENKDLPPREKFIKQLQLVLESVIANKEFMIMQTREQAIPLNEKIKEELYKMQLKMHQFFQQGLLNIYGEHLQPFIWDLSLMLEGMIHSYLRIMLFNNEMIRVNLVLEFMIRRMDDIVLGLDNEKPLVNDILMKELIEHSKSCFQTDLHEILSKMKKIIMEIDNKEDLTISLEVLEQEIQKEKPRIPVIQGMLFNFNEVEELKVYRNKIAAYFQIQ